MRNGLIEQSRYCCAVQDFAALPLVHWSKAKRLIRGRKET